MSRNSARRCCQITRRATQAAVITATWFISRSQVLPLLAAAPNAALASHGGEAASTVRRSAPHSITSQTAVYLHRDPPYGRHTQAHCTSTDSALGPPP